MDSTPVTHDHYRHPTGGRTRLTLVRHGRTVGNLQRRLQGVTDLPLDELGEQQALWVAEHLAPEAHVSAIISSPLQRARATAAPIAARLSLQPVVVRELTEMNFGDMEGMTLETLVAQHPELAAKAMDPEDDTLVWPNGESRREFHVRVDRAFRHILTEYHEHRVIVVAHNGVLGSWLAQVRGLPPNDWQAYRLGNCSVSRVEISVDGAVVDCVNDVRHLEVKESPLQGDPR